MTAAISSQGSPGGSTPSALPDGETDLFGQALAPASPSAKPAGVRGMKTSATFGRLGSGSSESAAAAVIRAFMETSNARAL